MNSERDTQVGKSRSESFTLALPPLTSSFKRIRFFILSCGTFFSPAQSQPHKLFSMDVNFVAFFLEAAYFVVCIISVGRVLIEFKLHFFSLISVSSDK